jgi:hypothetical protein
MWVIAMPMPVVAMPMPSTTAAASTWFCDQDDNDGDCDKGQRHPDPTGNDDGFGRNFVHEGLGEGRLPQNHANSRPRGNLAASFARDLKPKDAGFEAFSTLPRYKWWVPRMPLLANLGRKRKPRADPRPSFSVILAHFSAPGVFPTGIASDLKDRISPCERRSAQIPERSAQIPEGRAHFPEPPAQIPETRARIPQRRAQIPEARAQVPEVCAQIPGWRAHIPQARA